MRRFSGFVLDRRSVVGRDSLVCFIHQNRKYKFVFTESKYIGKYTVATTQKAEGVMVWCAMKSNGQLFLRRCPPKVKAAEYQGILQDALTFIKPRFVHKVGLLYNQFFNRASRYVFQRDGAPPHTARSTQAWLNTHHVRRFNGGIWPSMSPDLNPIEHVWPIVGNQLVGKSFASKDALFEGLKAAFASVTPAQVATLFASMPNRMSAVLASKGGHTRY